MATSVFYSFHWQRDVTRVQKVANINALSGQSLSRQNWESVKKNGRAAIEKYIDDEMAYKRAVVVLVGLETATRPWVQYEIKKAWSAKKPLVGIRINALENLSGATDKQGPDPFAQFGFSDSDKTYADYVPVFTPKGATSSAIYNDILNNIDTWVDNAYRRP